MSSIGQYIRDICALCLANFSKKQNRLSGFYARMNQTELVSLDGPYPFRCVNFCT